MRRTNADKRRCVEIALKEFAGMSDRAVAEMCGVGYSLVADVRKDQLPESDSSPRQGLDGKTRAMPRTAKDVFEEAEREARDKTRKASYDPPQVNQTRNSGSLEAKLSNQRPTMTGTTMHSSTPDVRLEHASSAYRIQTMIITPRQR